MPRKRKCRQKRRKDNIKQEEEDGRSRGELRAEWSRTVCECSMLLYPLSSRLSHPLSSWAPWASASQLIPLTFTLFSQPFSEPSHSLCQHPQWPQVDERWWLVQAVDYSSRTGAQPMRKPLETLLEPRSCILCYIIQYVLNKIGLVWVEE